MSKNMKLSNEKADKYLEEILKEIRNTLMVKAKEYVRNDDRMHNFNQGSKKKNVLREEIIEMFRLKHEISRDDLINDLKEGKLPTKAYVKEKYGDIINYYILEQMSLLHRIEEQEELNKPIEDKGVTCARPKTSTYFKL